MGKLELLFKKENVEYIELENELTKNEMFKDRVQQLIKNMEKTTSKL